MRLPRIAFGKRLLAGFGVVALVVLFCLGLVRRNHTVFWNDDYQVSILPVLTDVARSWREGHWPLLSPYSWACGNLAGEYQYGTFSVFVNAGVVLVFAVWTDFALQAAALSIIHLAALALGAYLLARGRRLPAALATVVALIAALNGWEIGWGATDWFGALAADAWLPWAWWAFERAMREDGDPRAGRLRWLLPAPFVYLVMTGGFPYTVVRLALVTAWLVAHALARRRWRSLWPLTLGWIFGLGLSAPAWLSLLETIRGSTRSQGAGVGNIAWTVPPAGLPGLILPNWTTKWNDFAAIPSAHAALELAGGLVPLAALLAAFACARGRAWRALRWDLLLLGAVVVLCVLPSPGMFRWSFRWLPLFHLVFALIGARALHLLASCRPRRLPTNPGAWATGLTGAAWILMSLCKTANDHEITWYLPLWTLLIAVAWLALSAFTARRGTWAAWLPALATLASLWTTYQHMYTNPGLPKYAFGPSLAKVSPLSADRLYLSLYDKVDEWYRDWQTPPDFGAVVRPGSTGMYAGVRTLNGYSPIMPPGVGRLWNMETHGSIPEDTGRSLLPLAGHLGPLEWLGVDGILIERNFGPRDVRLNDPDWETASESAEGFVYHRRNGPLPEVRAWHAESMPSVFPNRPDFSVPSPFEEVQIRSSENSRAGSAFDVSVPAGNEPGALLAFRRPYFPGYVAALDGAPVAVSAFQNLFPTITLPPGSHGRLVLSYRPRAVVWGAVAAGMSLLAMGGFAVWTRRVKAG